MSIRYWLYAIALGGCLSLGALSNAYADHHPETPGIGGDHTATQQTQSNSPTTKHLYIEKQPSAISQQACNEAKRHGLVVDECQQRDMAIAAAKQTSLTTKLYDLTLWEVRFLVAALILSAIGTGAAGYTVWLTRKNTQIELRAYVSISPGGIIYDFQKSRLLIIISHQNSGQTPARNLRRSIIFERLPYPLPKDQAIPDPNFYDSVENMSAGKESETRAPFSEFIDRQEDIDAMLLPPAERIYAICVITYEDVFGDKHQTRTCWSYNPVGINLERAMEKGPISVPVEFTDQHNDEC